MALKREKQIEFMDGVQKRRLSRMAGWLSDSTVRKTLAQPAPGQPKVTRKVKKKDLLVPCGN